MCCTGKCEFENGMGICTILNFNEFWNRYKYPACLVGGIAFSKQEQEFIHMHYDLLKEIQEKYYSELR